MAKQAQIDAVKPALDAADEVITKAEKVLKKADKVAAKGTKALESGLETVADVVPEALDDAVHVSTKGGRKLLNYFRDPKHLAVSIVVLSSAAGAALGVAGYFAMKKQMEAKLRKEYDEHLESEVAELRRYYELRHKDGQYATPAGAVEALLPGDVQEVVRSYQGVPTEPVAVTGPPVVVVEGDSTSPESLREQGYTEAQIAEVTGTPVDVKALEAKMNSGGPIEVTETTSNIFVDGNPIEDFDYAAEVAKRNPEEPYVITHDEFMENENDFAQMTMTYYNGDDILADDQDIPVVDIEAVVGSENLTKFGYGSRDRNVVYVRNEKLENDYEIALSQGEFSKEVAGFTELRHSAPVRKFRAHNE